MIYSGYGVMLQNEIVYTTGSDNLKDAIAVRDRDYPEGKLVKWAQGLFTPTIYQLMEDK